MESTATATTASAVLDSFLRLVQMRRQSIAQQPPTFAYLQERIWQNKRRRYLLAGLLLSSPWIYRFLRERFYRSSVYRHHRQRHESFTHHLMQAEKQQLHSVANGSNSSSESAEAGDSIVAAAAAVSNAAGKSASGGKVAVNRDFFRKLSIILKIIIPGWWSEEMRMLVLHSAFLVLRTYLSVVVARIDGRIVKDLVNGFISIKIPYLNVLFTYRLLGMVKSF